MDILGMLERSLPSGLAIEEGDYRATRCIGSGPNGSSYYDIHTIQIDSIDDIDCWKDNFRYQLKKHEQALDTMVFDDSTKCGPKRLDDLHAKLRMESSFEPRNSKLEFHSVSFKRFPNHEYFIFVFPRVG